MQKQTELITSLLRDIENMVVDKNKKQYNAILERKQNKISKLDNEVKRLKKILCEVREERNQIIERINNLTKERDAFKVKAEENKQVKTLKENLKKAQGIINNQNQQIENLDLSLRQNRYKKRAEIINDVVFVEFLNIMEQNIPNFTSLKNTFKPEIKLAIIQATNRRRKMEREIKQTEEKLRKKYNGSFSDFFKAKAEYL